MKSNVEKEFNLFGKRFIKQSRTLLTKGSSNDTKDLYNSIDYKFKKSKRSIEFSIVMNDYGKFIDEGVRGAGGVRKTTSNFKRTNNKGKLWKIKSKNSRFKFGKSGGISPKHFEGWAKRRNLSPFAIAKVVYHQGIEAKNFIRRPFELAYKKLPEDIIEAYGFDLEKLIKFAIK